MRVEGYTQHLLSSSITFTYNVTAHATRTFDIVVSKIAELGEALGFQSTRRERSIQLYREYAELGGASSLPAELRKENGRN